MNRKVIVISTIVAIFLIFMVLILFGFISIPSITGFFIGTSKETVGNRIKSLYELANPGTIIEIVTITEESGIYKIVLRASDFTGTTYREIYVTKDGKLLTENVIFVEESIAQIEKMKNFVNCLDERGVRIFGVSNQTASLLQLNVLGRYGLKLFVACDINMDACLAAKVTQVPSVVIGNLVDPGVKTIDWFERTTECKF